MKSLFGHIVLNFTSQSENLATEGLLYIIKNSSAARTALQRYLKLIVNDIPDIISFRTQVYNDDQSIPDMVGFDEDNDQICVIEAKFWAGLTENQPVTYLKHLNPKKPSILLFLAPSKRMESLWSELRDRCTDEKINLTWTDRQVHSIWGKINENNYLCVTNWHSMMNILETEIEAHNDYKTKSDIIQLKGLISQIEEASFLPLNSIELSPSIAKRNLQFAQLVDDIITVGKAEGQYSTEGVKASCGLNWYGRYFKINDFHYVLKFDNRLWNEFRDTPLWLGLYGKGWLSAKEERSKVKKALIKLDEENKLFNEIWDVSVIPIKLELNSEKDKVVKSILSQIDEYHHLLEQNYIED